jgi:hypothetical protein
MAPPETSGRPGSGLVLGLALALVLLAPGAALAAAGSDAIGGAPLLFFSAPGDGNNALFGIEGGEPVAADADCPAMTRTAWWRIIGTGQPITLDTAGSTFNTVVAVYANNGGAPAPGNRRICNDNVDDGIFPTTSRATFASVRGTSYLVQVGVNGGAAGGTMRLTASAPRPANDDLGAAQVLQTGVASTVSNLGASQEPGETLACGAAPFAATTWFRWTAPGIGDAVFSSSAAFGDTVLSVYRASDGALLGCNDDAGQALGPSQVALRVAAGDYLLQVGAKGADGVATGQGDVAAAAAFALDPDVDRDGVLASSDCNDADPAIRPGVVDIPEDGIDQDCDKADAINLDRDRDGFNRPGDCNDADPKIHPQVLDIPGNKVDEDCTAGAAAFPRLPTTLSRAWTFPPFKFTRLVLNRVVAGTRVELRCRGGGCPKKKTRVIRVRKAQRSQSVLSYVKNARLRRGSVLEVRVTKAQNVGVMVRFTMRGARNPRVQELCLPVGTGKPKAC